MYISRWWIEFIFKWNHEKAYSSYKSKKSSRQKKQLVYKHGICKAFLYSESKVNSIQSFLFEKIIQKDFLETICSRRVGN